MVTSTQEALWVLRAQCGDREALQLLLRSVQPMLYRYVRGIVGASSADDLLQDVLIVLSRKLGSLHAPALFRAWAYRVAGRAAFRYLRKEKRWSEQVRDESVLDEVPAPELVPSGELVQEVLSMNEVSPACRAVLVLHFQEELSLQEVAAILAIPLGTVKSRLAYGLAAIRKKLKSN
jgi:RNA polymerase sigma-70 factor (ECF subfamily)